MFDKRSARRELEKRNRLRAKAKSPLIPTKEELAGMRKPPFKTSATTSLTVHHFDNV